MTTAKKTPTIKKPARTVSPLPAAKPPRNAIRPAGKLAVAAAPIAPPPAKPMAKKPVKAKKPKLVRDSFTIPKAEYLVLEDLKQRAGKMSSPAKKSELLRAGLHALALLDTATLVAALGRLQAVKIGRPKSGH